MRMFICPVGNRISIRLRTFSQAHDRANCLQCRFKQLNLLDLLLHLGYPLLLALHVAIFLINIFADLVKNDLFGLLLRLTKQLKIIVNLLDTNSFAQFYLCSTALVDQKVQL